MGSAPRVLVVAFGSAGKRHAQNLAKLGSEIVAVDRRADRRAEAESLLGAATFATLEAALASGSYDGAVVATPTVHHVEQTEMLMAAGCRVLLEKPIAMDCASAQRLARQEAAAGTRVLLGYTWRWWPALIEFKRRLASGNIGRLLRIELVMASHLEDWHPWEPLSDFFVSRASEGGGALLEESHWLDQLNWLVGQPDQIAADIERVGRLDMDCDDFVELRLFYQSGLRGRIHLDLLSRPAERSITVHGERGRLSWNFERNVISTWRVGSPAEENTFFDGERNDMFMALAADFLGFLTGRVTPSCTVADGIAVMNLIEAARHSHSLAGARVPVACDSR